MFKNWLQFLFPDPPCACDARWKCNNLWWARCCHKLQADAWVVIEALMRRVARSGKGDLLIQNDGPWGGEASSRINVHINDNANRPLHAFKDTGGWDCFWNLTAHGSYQLISPAPCTLRTFPLSAGSAQHINVHCIPTWVLGTTVIKIAAIRILHVVLFRIRLIWAPFCRQNLSPHGLVRLLTLRHNRRLRVAGYCRADRFLLMSVASEQPWARSHLQGGANRTPQSNLDQEQ